MSKQALKIHKQKNISNFKSKLGRQQKTERIVRKSRSRSSSSSRKDQQFLFTYVILNKKKLNDITHTDYRYMRMLLFFII